MQLIMNFISDFPNTGFLLVKKKKNHIFYKTQKMEIEFKIIKKNFTKSDFVPKYDNHNQRALYLHQFYESQSITPIKVMPRI